MFACLYVPGGNPVSVAFSFSPVVEQTSTDTVVFSIDGLERLIGTPHEIASEICRLCASRGIYGNLGIAQNPDTALLTARNRSGVTIVSPGQEEDALASLSIEVLETDPAIIETLESWGIQTLGDLAVLPEMGLAARLGDEGIRLQRLALGRLQRPLHAVAPALTFASRVEFDNPIALLEPLLFVLSPILHDLTEQMRRHSVAPARTELVLELDNKSEHRRILELSSPCGEHRTLLKLLQLDLEVHPPASEILALRLELHPVPRQELQHGLFIPATPEPQKLQIVAARLAGLVGEGNVGTPSLLDTHRPDAFVMRPFRPPPVQPHGKSGIHLRPAFRLFRPAPGADVRLKQNQPAEVNAPGVRGSVRAAAGPWHSSGDWWTDTRWNREEWDVDLSDGGIYRIYCRLDSRRWFVEGVYD